MYNPLRFAHAEYTANLLRLDQEHRRHRQSHRRPRGKELIHGAHPTRARGGRELRSRAEGRHGLSRRHEKLHLRFSISSPDAHFHTAHIFPVLHEIYRASYLQFCSERDWIPLTPCFRMIISASQSVFRTGGGKKHGTEHFQKETAGRPQGLFVS